MTEITQTTTDTLDTCLTEVKTYLENQVLGQTNLVERLLMALLANGHILVEGAPGLAKTRAVRALSQAIEGEFQRIQFTPDLLPADITGTEIFRPQDGSFVFQPGPIFHNYVLADEINRAPAKVQAALLEAMGERQITVGNDSMLLAEPFIVMATQNPIEQEGTYPLPEAQLDRFLLHVTVDFPDKASEIKILQLARNEASEESIDNIKSKAPAEVLMTKAQLLALRKKALEVFMAEDVEEYLITLIQATREPANFSQKLTEWIEFGVSPRATIGLDRCVRVRAMMNNRDYVTPDDIQNVLPDILRHRLILRYQAEASGITSDKVITELLSSVTAP